MRSKQDHGLLHRGDSVCYVSDEERASVSQDRVESIVYRPEDGPPRIVPALDWNSVMTAPFEEAMRYEFRMEGGDKVFGAAVYPQELSPGLLSALQDLNDTQKEAQRWGEEEQDEETQDPEMDQD